MQETLYKSGRTHKVSYVSIEGLQASRRSKGALNRIPSVTPGVVPKLH